MMQVQKKSISYDNKSHVYNYGWIRFYLLRTMLSDSLLRNYVQLTKK